MQSALASTSLYHNESVPVRICRCLLFSCSIVADSFLTPRPAAHQAPLSTGFSGHEYWSGWPLPSRGDPPDPGIKPRSPALAGLVNIEPSGKAIVRNSTLVLT